MLEHNSQPRTANVVATFDTQDEADEALLEVRLAGFRDRRVAYFARTPTGELTDLLERNSWITGAAIGAIVGALLGVWLARIIPGWESPYVSRLDAYGQMVTCATNGSMFLSCAGGKIGAGITRRWQGTPTHPSLLRSVRVWTGNWPLPRSNIVAGTTCDRLGYRSQITPRPSLPCIRREAGFGLPLVRCPRPTGISSPASAGAGANLRIPAGRVEAFVPVIVGRQRDNPAPSVPR